MLDSPCATYLECSKKEVSFMGPMLTTMLQAIKETNLWDELMQHPFNLELASGSLDASIFAHFLRLDQLYLNQLATILKSIAENTTLLQHKHPLLALANMTVHAEQDMLSQFLPAEAGSIADLNCEVLDAYVSHLKSSARMSSTVAVASVIPCFFLYLNLGQMMAQVQTPDNRYQKWIDTYSDPEFQHETEALLAILEELALNDGIHEAMITAFVQSANHEMRFFESVYRTAWSDEQTNEAFHFSFC